MFEVGQTLENKYEILEHIGTGGGGIVYKAFQKGLNKTVAIKQIKDELNGVINIHGEADILKNLKNDYIPSVYDFIVSNGQVYTVMEFIEGKSFQELITKGKEFSQKRLLKYSRQLCKAVSYLHSRKPPIIHSDIKPANIMLTSEDNICLIDYNISLIVDGNANAIGVSDGYSPPEQYGKKDMNNIKSLTLSEKTLFDTSANEFSAIDETLLDGNDIQNKTLADVKFNYTKTLPDKSFSRVSEDTETLIDRTAFDKTFICGDNNTIAVDQNNHTKTLLDKSVGKASENVVTLMDKSVLDETLADKNMSVQPQSVQTPISSARNVDERSDIYSIGATLYCLAAGEPPAISTGAVVPLSQKNNKISESFAAIIEKAMNKDPAKRFQKAEQMLKALNNLRRYDKRYKAMLLRQEVAIIAVVAAMALSGLTVVLGYSRIGNEGLEQYISYIIEMDNADGETFEEYYNKAIKCIPERAEAYEKKAYRIYDAGEYFKAENYINEIISGRQLYVGDNNEIYSYEKMYYILGRCYLETGEYDLSADALEKATLLNDNEAAYFCDLAVALARCGESEKAENILEIAVDKGLANDSILFATGEIEYSQGKYSDSINNLKKCIETTHDNTIKYRAYVICTNAYADAYDEKIFSCAECTNFFNTAIEKTPIEKTMPFYEMLARVNISEAQTTDDTSYYAAAINSYEKMNSLGWETIEIDRALIRLYRYVGNYSYAKEFALEILQNGDDYEIYKILAFVESDIQNSMDSTQRDYTEFSKYYSKARELCSDSEDFEMQWLDDAYNKLLKEGYIEG